MKATFISTESEGLEACIEVEGQRLRIMDGFGGPHRTPGEEMDIDISAGLFSDQESWDDIFGGNGARDRRLVELVGWAYRAYGIVVAINPVRADCGVLELEVPISTNDERVIGAPVAFTIARL